MKNVLILLFTFTGLFSYGQERVVTETAIAINNLIEGTLLASNNDKILAIIIAGSGPTDRNGNQNFLKSYSLKKLATSLTNNGIATFRYDKRIVKQIKKRNVDLHITFDDFVTDAISVIDYFKSKNDFEKIYVIGHSQGSLVGMLAAKNNIDGFISLAGAGQSIDNVIIEQIEKTAPGFTDDTKRILELLKLGKTTNDYPVALASVFNKDIQPFMISWIKYNPQEIIANLDMPILLINGTKDLQVSINEVQELKKASESAVLKIIKNMNHILFIIEGDDLENSKSYNESHRPVSEELINEITKFIFGKK